MNFTTRKPLPSHNSMEDDTSNLDSRPRPQLVPAYSMPGAPDDEITFDTWKKQQQRQKDIVPLAPPADSVTSPSYPHHQPCLRERQSHGESTPTGCSETKSDVQYAEAPVSSESPQPRPCVQQAWGSQTQLVDGQTKGGGGSTHTPSRLPSGRTTPARETQRKEKIISDW